MGPSTLHTRLGHLNASRIAGMDEEAFVAVCCAKPAIHRFPAVMGRRIHALCSVLAFTYGGKGANVWKGAETGEELYARLRGRLRRGEGQDHGGHPRQANGCPPAGLGGGRRQVRRDHSALGRRHRLSRLARRRPRMEALSTSGGQGQARPRALTPFRRSHVRPRRPTGRSRPVRPLRLMLWVRRCSAGGRASRGAGRVLEDHGATGVRRRR